MRRILLVEDDPKDVEPTLTALEEYNLANEVVAAHDGEEALDYLYCRGNFAGRPGRESGSPSARPEIAQAGRFGGAAADQIRQKPQDNSRSGAHLIPGRKRYGDKLPTGRQRVGREAAGFPRVCQRHQRTRHLLGNH
jgi:hypothetical protein